jgi:Leucine Rich repeat
MFLSYIVMWIVLFTPVRLLFERKHQTGDAGWNHVTWYWAVFGILALYVGDVVLFVAFACHNPPPWNSLFALFMRPRAVIAMLFEAIPQFILQVSILAHPDTFDVNHNFLEISIGISFLYILFVFMQLYTGSYATDMPLVRYTKRVVTESFDDMLDVVGWHTRQCVVNEVTILYFVDGIIGDSGAEIVAAELLDSTSITKILLTGNNIGATGATALANTIANKHMLQHLDLSRNKIGAGGIEALAEQLPSSNLRHLSLNKVHPPSESLGALFDSLPDCKHLETLELCSNDLTYDDIVHLAGVLPRTSITTLSLRKNSNIGDAGAKVLAAALHRSALQELHLCFCDIGDDGAKALAAGFSTNPQSLCTLRLVSNRIEDDGATAIANSLASSKIQELMLTDNCIGDVGAYGISQAIPQCNELCSLYLAANSFSSDSARSLQSVAVSCNADRASPGIDVYL